jgi:hypothetical protein
MNHTAKTLFMGILTSGLMSVAAGFVPSYAETSQMEQSVWTFNKLENIGGATTHVEGHPQIIDTPAGKAVQFNGVDDALFVDKHPLAGAKTFSFEAIFRPDGGAFEQRWFHLSEIDPATGKDSESRFLFEIRVKGDQWYLDAFVTGPGYKQTLVVPEKLFPVGRWYSVAQVFDGKTYSCYVDGVLQMQADIDYKPQAAGHSSVGVRINRVNYFKGAILNARFTDHALKPNEFLTVPAGLNK